MNISYMAIPALAPLSDDEKVAKIIEAVCEYFVMDTWDLYSQSREREPVYARQLAFYLIRQKTRYPLKRIGALFGGRDHSTALHGINTIKDLIFSEPATSNDLRIINKIAGI